MTRCAGLLIDEERDVRGRSRGLCSRRGRRAGRSASDSVRRQHRVGCRTPTSRAAAARERRGRRRELQGGDRRSRAAIKPNGAIWVVWPKGRKELREDDVRAFGPGVGLVDVKVVSVSEILSGLKMVIPLAQR